ncbi:MAG TPA: hypothetical protein VGQ99_09755 [Tepidisphaeraceae bacterium]|jgi:T5SS/PEP-CTERM-associated repeat protein|nr:hypothetical protein [Tepidisphaeraceae bacterium]
MSPARRTRLLAFCASAALAAFPLTASASLDPWKNSGGGSYSLVGNWFSGVPGASDTALFDLGSISYTISFDSSPTANQLIVGRDTVTFDLTGHTYTLGSLSALPSTPSLAVGELSSDNASLRLISGTLVDHYGVIGKDSASHGALTVSTNATLNSLNNLDIGYGGNGQLTINSGGHVTAANATIGNLASGSGFATVTGFGSQWSMSSSLLVGSAGTGALTITEGASVSSPNTNVSGGGAGGNLTLSSSFASARLTGDSLFVGASSSAVGQLTIGANSLVQMATHSEVDLGGTANINPGGTLATRELVVIGGLLTRAAAGRITIDNPVSTSGTELSIGANSHGYLAVVAGGVFNNNGNAYIGENTGSGGDVLVRQFAAWNNTGYIAVGYHGTGSLAISDAGIVSAASVYVSGFSSANGSVNVEAAGSSLTASNSFVIGGLPLSDGGAASLTVRSGATATASNLIDLRPAGTITLIGTGIITTPVMQIRGGTVNEIGGTIKIAASGSVPAAGIYVALNTNGTLFASAGAHLNTTGVASIAQYAGGNGNAQIVDPGSIWTHTGELSVGVEGNGNLFAQSGGHISNTADAYVARAAGSAGTVIIDGLNSRLDIGGQLFAGLIGNAHVNVTNGGTLTNATAYMASNPGSNSEIHIEGSGATWNITGILNVGGPGGTGGNAVLYAGAPGLDGFVHVTDSIEVWPTGHIVMERADVVTPRLEILGSVHQGFLAPLHISSAGTPDFFGYGTYVGMAGGTGTIAIASGGGLYSSNEVVIANTPGSVGNVSVDSASHWTFDGFDMYIGYGGNGTVSLAGGSVADTFGSGFNTTLGTNAGAQGILTVSGGGTEFDAQSQMDVGQHGAGFLTIQSGGRVASSIAHVGRFPDGKGTVQVIGTGANWTLSSLIIGGDDAAPGGPALVDIESLGFIQATSDITIWTPGTLVSYPSLIATPHLRLRGGTISTYGNINAPIDNGGGTIDVPASQSLVHNNTITSTPGSILQKTGLGEFRITGGQTHAPGAVFQARGGQTIIESQVGLSSTPSTPATANLSLIVGPERAGVTLDLNQVFHDVNVLTSNPGRQSLNLNSPTTPFGFRSLGIYQGNKIDLWSAIKTANRAGAPDPQDGIFDSSLPFHPNSGIGIAKLSDLHGDTYLLIRPTRIGDLNLDGVVTISDFIDLSSNFGSSGPNITWQEGDLNYDNAVTISDFIDLSANFGASYSGATTGISPSDLVALNDFAASHNLPLLPEPRFFLVLFALAPLLFRPHCERGKVITCVHG